MIVKPLEQGYHRAVNRQGRPRTATMQRKSKATEMGSERDRQEDRRMLHRALNADNCGSGEQAEDKTVRSQ